MAIGFDELWQKMKPRIVDLLSAIGGGSGPFAPSPHDMSGSHHTGNISDAQHGSRTVANAHRHGDMSNIGPNDHHNQQHALDGPDHIGTLGASQLPSYVVTESDASGATPTAVGASAASPGSVTSQFSRPDHRHIIDLAMNAIWTGWHTFRQTLVTRDILPETGDTYDIGAVNNRYRTLRVAELAATVFSKESVVIVGNTVWITKGSGALAAALDASSSWIDFGQGMTVNDWVIFQSEDTSGNPSVEWINIASHVGGTTYNCWRNIDGSGANHWPAGTPFVVVGQPGDYRIVLEAGSDINIRMVQQGSAWNITSEVLRFDKNGFTLTQAGFGNDAKLWLKKGSQAGLIVRASGAVGDDHSSILAQGESGSNSASLGIAVNNLSTSGGVSISLKDTVAAGRRAYMSMGNLSLPLAHYDYVGPMLSLPAKRAVWTPELGLVGTSGSGVVKDLSGQDRDLQPMGTIYQGVAAYTAGYPNVSAVSAPAGGGNYLQRGDEFGFHLGMEWAFTAMIWVQFADANFTTVSQFVMGQGDIGYPNSQWYLWSWNGMPAGQHFFTFSVHDQATQTMVSVDNPVAIVSNAWYFVAVRYYSGLWMNTMISQHGTNALVKSERSSGVPTSLYNSTNNFRIGRGGGGYTYMNGWAMGATCLLAGAVNDETVMAVYESQREYYGKM
jgi:hypothetical protein